MENKTMIILIGTCHISGVSKKKIETVFDSNNFDCLLREGSLKKLTLREMIFETELVKDIPLLIALILYDRLVIRPFCKDMPTADLLAKDKKIPIFSIDLALNELFSYFHHRRNYLVFGFISFIGVILFLSTRLLLSRLFNSLISLIFSLILALLVTESIYLYYFVMKTKNIRDCAFIDKGIKIIQKYKFKKALLICGEKHLNQVQNGFQEKGFIVKDGDVSKNDN